MQTIVAPDIAALDSVLCVDLDSTLIKTDLAWECFAELLRYPLKLLHSVAGIRNGLVEVKRRLADRAAVDLNSIPLRPEVIAYLRAAKKGGRVIVLATAADHDLAVRMSDRVGLFDQVIASADGNNLKGIRKLAEIERRFPGRSIEYMGDSRADRAIFERVQFTTLVKSGLGLSSALSTRKDVKNQRVIAVNGGATWKSLVAALRPAHWSKNVLIFVPLLVGHRWRHLPEIVSGLLGFVAFCLAASSVYILNDILDLKSDRLHLWKRNRPFADCRLSIPFGLSLATALLMASLAVSWSASSALGALLIGIYVASALAYSISLKKQPILDVLLLSSFYLQRVVFGGYLSRVSLSNWLLAFCMFFFLSLALAKRCSELLQAGDVAESGRSGRGYLPGDIPFVRELGIGSGLISVLVIALYINGSEISLLYRHAPVLWAVVPILLYWISRIWLISSRGLLVDDPIGLAFKDKASIFAGVLLITIALFATF